MKKIFFSVVFILLPFVNATSQTRLETCIQNMVSSFANKDYDNAIVNLNEAISLSPNDERLWGQRGYFYLYKNEYQKALLDFNKALEVKPGNPPSLRGRAWVKYALKDTKGSIEDYSALIASSPSNEDYFNRGKVYLEQQDLSNAESDFNTCLSKGYESGLSNFFLALVKHIYKGDILAALKYYNASIAADPVNVDAYFRRGDCYFRLKRFDEARQDFIKCTELKPNFAFYYCAIARTYITDGKEYWLSAHLSDASSYFNKAFSLEPTLFEARLGVIQCKIRSKDYDGVEDALRALSNDFSNRPEIMYENGLAAYQQKTFLVALYQLNKAILVNSQYSDAYLLRTKVNIALGNYTAAYDDANATLSLDSLMREAWLLRGQLRDKLYYGVGALADFTRSLECPGPKDQAYRYRAMSKIIIKGFGRCRARLFGSYQR